MAEPGGFEPPFQFSENCVLSGLDDGPKLGAPAGILTRIPVLGGPCPIQVGRRAQMGWPEELESSFTGSQPAALPYKLRPQLVELGRIELPLLVCRTSALPTKLQPRTWSGVRESNPPDWFGRPAPKAIGQPRMEPIERFELSASSLPKMRTSKRARRAEMELSSGVEPDSPMYETGASPSMLTQLDLDSRLESAGRLAGSFTPAG